MTRFVLRMRATLSRRHDRDLRDELQLHLQLLEDEFIAAGVPADEARRRAHQEFGNATLFQETSHDLFSFSWLEELSRDLRYAGREMRRRPWFTTVAVASLAIGIGAITATFTILDAFMLRHLPVRHPERLVAFSTNDRSAWASWSYAFYVRLREAPDRPFDVAAVSDIGTGDLSGVEEGIRVSLVSANYFDVFGVDLPLGASFHDDTSADPSIVISDAFWQRWFGRAQDVLGRIVTLRNTDYRVIGVTGRGFTGHAVGHPIDVWMPLSMQAVLTPRFSVLFNRQPGADPQWLKIVGRLGNGAGMREATAWAAVVTQRFLADKAVVLGAEHPAVVRERKESLILLSAANGYAPERGQYGTPLFVLAGLTALVLLVACANFTNLMLVRAENQKNEFAIRLALGGGRWRLVRQATTECVLLALLAGLFGVLLAMWAADLSLKQFASLIVPLEFSLRVDARVLTFAGLCVALVVAFGLWPCTRPARRAVVLLVQHQPDRTRVSVGRMVLIAQLAMCTILLIGAGLLLRTVINLRFQELGFDRNVLLVSLSVPGAADSAAAREVVLRAKNELSHVPGIRAVGVTSAQPLDISHYWVDGSQRLATPDGLSRAGINWTTASVGPGFFEAAGVPLIRGRTFSDRDMGPWANAVIVNQFLARFLFGNENAVGRLIRIHPRSPMRPIIGVVSDARQISPRDRTTGVVYVPLTHANEIVLVVRTASGNPSDRTLVRQHLMRIAPQSTIQRVRTVAETLDTVIARERLMSGVSLVLAALVIAIGCVGLYALMSYEVVRRTHELGIRLALGATQGTVKWMLVKDTALVIGPALAIGIPAGVAASGLLTPQLYGVQHTDPWTLVSVTIVLTLIALVATFKPARTASQIDPLSLLHHD